MDEKVIIFIDEDTLTEEEKQDMLKNTTKKDIMEEDQNEQ